MKHLFIPFLLISVLQMGMSQRTVKSQNVENIEVTTSKVIFMGKTKAIRDLDRNTSISQEKMDLLKLNKKKPDNFKNRLNRKNVAKPELEHQGIDPIWQSTHVKSAAGVEPIVNIRGLGFRSPTDPTGSVGQDYYLQAVNVTDVGVYDKEGNEVTRFDMVDLWTGTGFNSGGDPIILYDQLASRWIVTEFATFPNTEMLIAVSETSDPLGSYFTYVFTTPQFPDYPKFGIWSDHLVLTTNEGSFGTLHQYFIEREQLLNGEDARMQRIEISGPFNPEQGFIVSTPVDWEGETLPEDSRPIVLKLNDSSWGEVAADAVELFRFDIDYDNANNTQVESLLINTTPYDSYPCDAVQNGTFSCCSQPDLNIGLDAIPEVIMNAPQYRNFGTHESLVMCFPTDVTNGDNQAGVRWVELRRESDVDWYVFQEGSYAPDTNHRYMAGIGIDKKGNISIAYNVSSDSVYAGIRYTGRYANDPLGLMTIPEQTIIDGNSALNSNGRFSDYTQIAVDPIDGLTFWFTGEYALNGNAVTRIASWQMAQDSFDISITAITSPINQFGLSTTEPIEIEVFNNGLETAESYSVSYSVEGIEIETMQINDPLTSGSRRMHTFSTTQDFSAFADYNVSAKIIYDLDENINNNETSRVVSNRPANDLTLAVQGNPQTCNIVAVLEFVITNNGGQNLTEANVDIQLDGMTVDTYSWTGNLSFGQSETVTYLLSDLPDGTSSYDFIIETPGATDANPTDNNSTFDVTSSGSAGFLSLNLQFDRWPNETSWEITEQESGAVVGQGGNYQENQLFDELIEELCLDPEGCYNFTISDSYGDGICCSFGEGGFSILNAQGQVVTSFFEEWGAEYSVDFCTSDIDCTINTSAEVQNEITGGELGTIIVSATGLDGQFNYSIDGGQTFQESNIFDNLSSGEYTIIVASGDCQTQFNVEVDLISNVLDLDEEALITATPNPNIGFFDLKVKNYESGDAILKFEVLDAQGKIVQSRNIGKYSGVYTTQVSLLNYPDGTYFIRFLDPNIKQLVKIIKLN